MMPTSFTKAFDTLFEEAFTKPAFNFTPALDIEEDDQNFTFSLTLAGLKKEEIKIDLTNDVLTISGERKLEKKESNKVHRVESYYGSFSRSFTLPENVKVDAISAEFNNGILHVTVPKGAVAQPKAIEIK